MHSDAAAAAQPTKKSQNRSGLGGEHFIRNVQYEKVKRRKPKLNDVEQVNDHLSIFGEKDLIVKIAGRYDARQRDRDVEKRDE